MSLRQRGREGDASEWECAVTMTDVMEITSNEGIPALPPLPRVTPVLHAPGEGDGQNWPSASAGIAIAAVVTSQPR